MSASHTATLRTVNEHSARIQAGFIAVAGTLFAVTGHWLLALLTAYDFAARLFISPKASPFHLLAGGIAKAAAFADRTAEAEPKRFAAGIWLAASLFMLYFALAGEHGAALAVAALLVVCTGSEALFNFCIGCKFYALLKRLNIEITSLKD